jgi:hypothetical protein
VLSVSAGETVAATGSLGSIQTCVDALNAHVALLDGAGEILSVNAAWRRFGRSNGAGSDFVGRNYLEICATSTGAGDPRARRAEKGLRALLAGRTEQFGLAYRCGDRTFRMKALAVPDPPVSIIVAHEDITPLVRERRAQDDAGSAQDAERLLADLHEEIGQRLAAIRFAAHSLERSGAEPTALAAVRIALDEAKMQLRRARPYLPG